MAPLQRSEHYYQDTITFQVEDKLFKVAKWYLVKHSPIFRDMFSVPPPTEQVTEGSSDDHPIVLEGVKMKDFEALLSMMYPEMIYQLPYERESSQPVVLRTDKETEAQVAEETLAKYTACLDLSRRWLFHQIHSEAVAQLGNSNLTAVDRVVLGKQYHVAKWIREGYRELVERSTMLSNSEAERLGPISTVGICNLREQRCERQAEPRNYTPVITMSNGTGKFSQSVKKKAKEELEEDHKHIKAIENKFSEELEFADSMCTDFYAGVGVSGARKRIGLSMRRSMPVSDPL